MKVNRREFLAYSLAGVGLLSLEGLRFKAYAGPALPPSRYLFLKLPYVSHSENHEKRKDGALVIDNGEGRALFEHKLPASAHSFSEHPTNKNVIIMIPKASQIASVFDFSLKRITHSIKSQDKYVFWGHGYFHGNEFYTSEILNKENKGLISIHDSNTFQFVKSFDAFGFTHDCKKDALSESLIVAGKHFLPELIAKKSFSSLRWFDTKSGKMLGYSLLSDPDMTAGHFEQNSDGFLVVSSFYKDTQEEGPGFVYFGKPQSVLQRGKAPAEIEKRMLGQAVGIVAHFQENVAMATHPQSDLVTFWDIEKAKLRSSLFLPKPVGCSLSPDRKSFILVTSQKILQIDVQSLKILSSHAHGGSQVSSHMLRLS